MESQRRPNCHDLALCVPNLFAIAFGGGEIVAPYQEELDEVEVVCAALGLAALHGDAHDVVEADAELFNVWREAPGELVLRRQIVEGDGHNQADGGEGYAVRRMPLVP